MKSKYSKKDLFKKMNEAKTGIDQKDSFTCEYGSFDAKKKKYLKKPITDLLIQEN